MTENATQTPAAARTLVALRKLGERGAPLEVGRISVRSNGEVELKEPAFPLDFTFRWHGTRFGGHVDKAEGHVVLRLSADLGTLPYTGEDRTARRVILDSMAAGASRSNGRLELTARNEIVLSNEIELPQPHSCTVKKLVSNVAILVLLARPFLDFFAELPTAKPPAAR